MAKMQSRSEDGGPSTPAAAGLSIPVWAIAIVVAGMVLIVLGVVHGGLFVPGVWVLILGFIALVASAVYAVATDRAERA